MEYIAYTLYDRETAAEWYANLLNKINTLTELPGRFPLVDAEPWRGYGIRRMVISNYNVLYWINQDEGTVIIMAISYYRCNMLDTLLNMPIL